MFRAIFTRPVMTMILGSALVGGTLTLTAAPAKAQAGIAALSPSSKQVLIAMLRGAPPHMQQLIVNAMQALGPERAEAQLAQVKAMPPQTLQLTGQLVIRILQILPRQYHQAFVNGLFQVTPAEEQYATQLMTQAVTAQAAASAGIAIPNSAMGAQPAEARSQMMDEILATQDRMYRRHNRELQDMQRTTRDVGDGWINVLGPSRPPVVVYPY
jgi:hypothetical protein